MDQSPIFDEMHGTTGALRAPYAPFDGWLKQEDAARLRQKQREAEEIFRLTGITFNVYGRAEAAERRSRSTSFPHHQWPGMGAAGARDRTARPGDQRLPA